MGCEETTITDTLLALTLAGCGKEEEEQEKKLPERFVEVSEDEDYLGVKLILMGMWCKIN